MDLFDVKSIPFMARRNYYHEFRNMICWSALAGTLEGQFPGVIVAKSFEGSEWAVAIASTSFVAAMTSSLIWGMLCLGRPKLRLLTWFCAGTALVAGALGAVPQNSHYVWWFVLQVAAAQVLLAGVITVRSAVWKVNYPRSDRGRITARLQAARIVTSFVTVLIAGALCEYDPSLYRFIFPAIAVAGLFSITIVSKLHLRGERRELKYHSQPVPDGIQRSGLAEPFTLTALLSPGRVLGQMTRVLRDDERFRKYIVAQLLAGLSNLMTMPIAIVLITQRLPMGTAWSFWVSTVLVEAIRRLLTVGTLRRWGLLFDRLGVVRFRVANCTCWALCLVFGLAGDLILRCEDGLGGAVLPLALLALALWSMMQGLAMGGGALAWNLGHLHFAHPRDAEVYMGIHVSLTGMRGLIAPLLGVTLWGLIGWGTWLVAIALALASLGVFISMARHERIAGVPTRPGST